MLLLIGITLLLFENSEQQQVCYGDLGCFTSNVPDSQLNPFGPQSPEYINTLFLLYKCDSRDTSQNISWNFTNQTIMNWNFSPQTPTKFVIHGLNATFFDSCENMWPVATKDYILRKLCPNVQVIGVDWHKGAENNILIPTTLLQAGANVKVVAAILAKLYNRLKTFKGLTQENTEFIGHSAGALVAGQAGRLIRPPIEMITGLDPPFSTFIFPDNELRLDRTDAKFVTGIHSNAGILTPDIQIGLAGLYEPINTYDYYLNGGSLQPNCNILEWGCSHCRPTDLAKTDPQNNCQFIAYKCDNYDNFQKGKCADCGPNGFDCRPLPYRYEYWNIVSNKNTAGLIYPNKLYLQTSGSSPYCQFHYQIKLWKTNAICEFIALDFNGQRVPNMSESNGFCTALLVSDKDFTPVTSVSVNTGFPNIFTVIRIEINYLSHIDSGYRISKSVQFCTSTFVAWFSGSQLVNNIC